MPQDDDTTSEKNPDPTQDQKNKKVERRQWFVTPPLIKRLFDTFPLVTYPSNELPQRTAKNRDKHALHVFATEDTAHRGAPSFNPGCLKWQVWFVTSNILIKGRVLNSQSIVGLFEVQTSSICASLIE